MDKQSDKLSGRYGSYLDAKVSLSTDEDGAALWDTVCFAVDDNSDGLSVEVEDIIPSSEGDIEDIHNFLEETSFVSSSEAEIETVHAQLAGLLSPIQEERSYEMWLWVEFAIPLPLDW